ncbi:MAG: hypothetical protein ABIU30_18380 [Ferruginibacter sp.]
MTRKQYANGKEHAANIGIANSWAGLEQWAQFNRSSYGLTESDTNP